MLLMYARNNRVWLRGQDLVTPGDPETSRLKTSFHRKVSLKLPLAVFACDLTVASSNLVPKPKKKRRPKGCRFFLVAGAGFEPAT